MHYDEALSDISFFSGKQVYINIYVKFSTGSSSSCRRKIQSSILKVHFILRSCPFPEFSIA
jgi:hypothetical protein